MKCTIDRIETNTVWDETEAMGSLEVTVRIRGLKEEIKEAVAPGLYLTSLDEGNQPMLSAYLTDPEGREMDRIFPLPLEDQIQFCMRVEDPKLWNAEEPYCYQMILEITEGEKLCLDRRVEPVAFSDWKIVGGQTCINGKVAVFRAASLPEGMDETDEILQFLQKMKQNFKNTLLVKSGEKSAQLKKWCLEYGIYLLEEGKDVDAGWLRAKLDMERTTENNPDFTLQVVQTGVLIENKSTFLNVSEYDVHYEVWDAAGRIVSENKLCTEVPAGTTKYVDIPFEMPKEPGEYCYRVALCLKKDTPWAPKGYAVVSAETKISNLYARLE